MAKNADDWMREIETSLRRLHEDARQLGQAEQNLAAARELHGLGVTNHAEATTRVEVAIDGFNKYLSGINVREG